MFVEPEVLLPEVQWQRGQIVDAIDKTRCFDIAIVGGGIHGAAMARIAALHGLKTVLLEMSDYASGTSSRSSKLAHGGLRYLAMGDFRQVYESVRAREEWYRVAPHLVKPHPFLIPVERGCHWQRLQYWLGLSLYEMKLGSKERQLSWRPKSDPSIAEIFAQRINEFEGCYQYFDGIMSDTRLVIETIFAARQEGARCLNYARVDSLSQSYSGAMEVGWTDMRTSNKHELTAGVVVNCAGPWVPLVGRLQPIVNKVRYSRGSHLIFSVPWQRPALFLPLQGKNRFYFVLPHPAGTLVGTTERECQLPLERDPIPSRDEVEEILHRLTQDLPGQGLNRSALRYGFAGIRTLPIRSGAADVSEISRRHRWELQGGVLNLYGGKYTSAYWTALEGLRLLQRECGNFEAKKIGDRPLPGAFQFQQALSELNISEWEDEQKTAVIASHRLYGGQIRRIAEFTDGLMPVGGCITRGAIEYACLYEQVETFEDLIRRRLELEYYSLDNEAIESIAAVYRELTNASEIDTEIAQYQQRLALLADILEG